MNTDIQMDEDDWAADTAAWQNFASTTVSASSRPQRVSMFGCAVLSLRRRYRYWKS
jgi:hypothetical protein